ncbi:response regulator transcription factor [Microbacterium sp. NPDC057650]|uniref:response regulator transcription factor n=1 Tax=unclassified Microbacterium TaxID=2609290 RepID=UPI00366F8EEB
MASDRPALLLVDDDDAITGALGAFLERSGYRVTIAGDGIAALASVAAERPDLVVCDVLMPRLDGREFVRRIRADDQTLPIILLTQVGESWERSAALDEGADDYLNKPFDPQELLSRTRAVLRRSARSDVPLRATQRLRSLDLLIDRTARRVWRAEQELILTPKAFTLLEYLMAHPNEVHTRERLLATLWGFDFATSSRAVDHRIAELRRVIGDNGPERFIETSQSIGYQFSAPVTPA